MIGIVEIRFSVNKYGVRTFSKKTADKIIERSKRLGDAPLYKKRARGKIALC